MRSSVHVGRIAGIEVELHYSWVAILVLVTWSLASGFLPQRYPDWAGRTYWATAVVASLLMFSSLLAHELAHSLVAKARGFAVAGITLFVLGAVSNLKTEPDRARDEFVISAVGPLTSLLLAAVFGVAALGFLGGTTPAAAVVWYLMLVNVVLAAFNLLPAYPLDGGRVLRSTIWAITGNLSRATRVATLGGQAFGVLLMALAVAYLMLSNLVGGLMIGVLGWFLHSSATATRRQAAVDEQLEGVTVREVMDVDPVAIDPAASIFEGVYDYLLRRGVRSVPVCDGDRLFGIISLEDIRGVPRERWPSVRISDAMTPLPLWQVGPDDTLSSALALLGEHSVHQAPVLEDGRLVGLLSRAHITEYLHSRRELGIR